MDIRNFFGGGSSSKKIGKSSNITLTESVTKNVSPSKSRKDKVSPGSKENKPKPTSKSSKNDESDEIIIDSDSNDVFEKKNKRNYSKKKSEYKRKDSSPVSNKSSKQKSDKAATDKQKKTSTTPTSKQKRGSKNKTEVFNEEIFAAESDDEGDKKHETKIDYEDEDEVIHKVKSNKRKSKGKKVRAVFESDSDDDIILSTPKPGASRKRGKASKTSLDSDEESQPKKKGSAKKYKKKQQTTYVSDSEEEKKPDILSAFAKVKAKTPTKPKEVKIEQPKSDMKITSAADFFGTASVNRSQPKQLKRKAEQVKHDDWDDEVHNDPSFMEALAQLDEQENKAKKVKLENEEIKIESNPANGKSLSSKLANRMSKASNAVDGLKTSPLKSSPSETKNKEKNIPVKAEKANIKREESHRKSPRKTDPATKKTPTKAQPKESPQKKSTPPSTTKEPKESPRKKSTPPSTTMKPKESPRKKSTTPSNAQTAENTPSAKQHNASYRSYLHRDGPQALGSKEIPEGGENCLEGLTFVITGVLESIERDEAKVLLERYGGKVTTSVSKRTSYMVVGRDAGASKLAKAASVGTKQIDEDGMLDLIRTLPGKKSKYVIAAEAENTKAIKQKAQSTPSSSNKTPKKTPTPQSSKVSSHLSSHASSSPSSSPATTSRPKKVGENELLWVDKYKPQSLKSIIGQQGDKSNAKKLMHWIKTWHRNRANNAKPSFNRFNDDGSGYKAALLSGPPGVGKTTTAQLVCKEAGLTYVELNASDTRSKKSLQSEVMELLSSHSLSTIYGSDSASGLNAQKHCLIMDEVDGMAGNQDRGGMAELIQLIKKAKIPIICMCNDRNSIKVRSLANHCFDLRFQRPRLEQIKGAMMSMAYKEGLKIPPPALNDIILSANQDIRQVIHNLSMWSADEKSINHQQLKKDAANARKDIKLGPFDVVRKVFASGEETQHMTIHDKSDLFFHDYSFGPLFVQENYINVQPRAASGNLVKHLELLARTADSIAEGDLVGALVRRNNWSLLPSQAMFSSVIPGELMRGYMSGQIAFPAWLGKNSSRNKTDRILQDIRTHACLRITGDKGGLATDYLPQLRKKLTEPLIQNQTEGVTEVIKILDDYDLQREDLDAILEVTTWPGMRDPMKAVETKTKSAFTRTYNKGSHMAPYAAVTNAKKGRGKAAETTDDGMMMGEEEAVIESDQESDDGLDSMIKPKKKPAARGKASGEKSQGAKGKGQAKSSRGRGKAKSKS